MKLRSHFMRQHKLFKEISDAQIALDLAIPRDPLIRIIRDIALRLIGDLTLFLAFAHERHE